MIASPPASVRRAPRCRTAPTSSRIGLPGTDHPARDPRLSTGRRHGQEPARRMVARRRRRLSRRRAGRDRAPRSGVPWSPRGRSHAAHPIAARRGSSRHPRCCPWRAHARPLDRVRGTSPLRTRSCDRRWPPAASSRVWIEPSLLEAPVAALYHARGYLAARAIATRTTSDGRAVITVGVDEGSRFTVGTIRFTGATSLGGAVARRASLSRRGHHSPTPDSPAH